MKLIKMVDFVLDTKQNLEIGKDFIEVVCNYANFLKQPLKLEMFVPCDDYGNILDRPLFDEKNLPYGIKYNKATAKVLFEGFQYCNELSIRNGVYWINLSEFDTIEDLIKYDLTLTKSAIKKLGL